MSFACCGYSGENLSVRVHGLHGTARLPLDGDEKGRHCVWLQRLTKAYQSFRGPRLEGSNLVSFTAVVQRLARLLPVRVTHGADIEAASRLASSQRGH